MKEFNENYIKTFIQDNYGKLSQQKIMKELHISNRRLIRYAKELNIYKPKEETIVFDDDKLEFINKNYKKMGASKIAKHFNCSEQVIYKYAKKLNKTNTCVIWEEEEKELLKGYYQSCTLKEMKKIFKKHGYTRTTTAIEGMAKKLKIYKDYTFQGEFLLSKDILEIMNFSKSKLNNLFVENKIKHIIYKRKRRVTVEDLLNI